MNRDALIELEHLLDFAPSVALLGPRQVGKTTLAHQIASRRPSVYLDLETSDDRGKLANPKLYLASHAGKLVIMDEIHRAPEIFRELRGIIDENRRAGRKTGQFLFLGSASMDLLRQTSESLAGRITYLEMYPLQISETPATEMQKLWSRGGFPDSFLATNDAFSLRWRRDIIRTYLERDIPQFAPRMPAETLRRFWTMLAHHQAGIFNASSIARALNVDAKTSASYADLLVDLLLLRRLQPWHNNIGKRLVKSPKLYVRDTGFLHALLGIPDLETLLGHPVVGASWETFVIENLLSAAPQSAQVNFYRTHTGAEIDLVLTLSSTETWAIEIKRSLTPRPEKGYHIGFEDIGATRGFCVYAGDERYPIAPKIEAISLADMRKELLNLHAARRHE